MRSDERRRETRVVAEVEVSYTPSQYAAETASVSQNLSLDGLCLPVRVRFEDGVRLRLRIDLPGELQPLLVVGEIVWMRADQKESGFVYEAGLHFIEMDPLDRRRLLKFLTTLQPSLSS